MVNQQSTRLRVLNPRSRQRIFLSSSPFEKRHGILNLPPLLGKSLLKIKMKI
jgi:hypothetical protein